MATREKPAVQTPNIPGIPGITGNGEVSNGQKPEKQGLPTRAKAVGAATLLLIGVGIGVSMSGSETSADTTVPTVTAPEIPGTTVGPVETIPNSAAGNSISLIEGEGNAVNWDFRLLQLSVDSYPGDMDMVYAGEIELIDTQDPLAYLEYFYLQRLSLIANSNTEGLHELYGAPIGSASEGDMLSQDLAEIERRRQLTGKIDYTPQDYYGEGFGYSLDYTSYGGAEWSTDGKTLSIFIDEWGVLDEGPETWIPVEFVFDISSGVPTLYSKLILTLEQE